MCSVGKMVPAGSSSVVFSGLVKLAEPRSPVPSSFAAPEVSSTSAPFIELRALKRKARPSRLSQVATE